MPHWHKIVIPTVGVVDWTQVARLLRDANAMNHLYIGKYFIFVKLSPIIIERITWRFGQINVYGVKTLIIPTSLRGWIRDDCVC